MLGPNEKPTRKTSHSSNGESELRLHEIALLAEAVAEEHCPKGRVEPVTILKNKTVTLSFGSYGSAFDGMLEHRFGRFHVYGNLDRLRDRESGRARFTLGHELGHFFIDDHRRALQSGAVLRHASMCDSQSRNPAEVEADHFASHLLLPTARFVREAKKYVMGLDAILALKDSFGTSITSTAIRYTKLDLAPCTLVKWDRDGFSWKWFSPSTYGAGYRRTIEAAARVPPDSATGRALSGAEPSQKGYFQAGTSARAWFPGAWTGTSRDIILIEQAIPLGEFGVLTLLFPEARKYCAAS